MLARSVVLLTMLVGFLGSASAASATATYEYTSVNSGDTRSVRLGRTKSGRERTPKDLRDTSETRSPPEPCSSGMTQLFSGEGWVDLPFQIGETLADQTETVFLMEPR